MSAAITEGMVMMVTMVTMVTEEPITAELASYAIPRPLVPNKQHFCASSRIPSKLPDSLSRPCHQSLALFRGIQPVTRGKP